MRQNLTNIGRNYCRLFCLGLVVFTLVACEAQPVLPTLAVPASLPALDTEATDLPPTWTPSPLETGAAAAGDANLQVAAAGPLLERTPTAATFLPTSTPRPTQTPTPTPTVEVTPTRYVSYIPNLPPSTELGPSKLGLHVIRANHADIITFIREGQPAVIKALDNFGYLMDVRAMSPRTTIVGRFNFHNVGYGGSPEEAARRFVAEQLDQYIANPAVDYWEGWNEPDPGLERMAWYARFEQERVREMAKYGFRTAVGGFPTGVPELDAFALFLPAIETAIQYGGILTLHEYGAPDMTFLYGSPLPGYPAYPDRGALTFRYRWYYRELLEPAGLVIPLVISEAGIDGILGNRPGPDGLGWADFQDYWVQQGWGRTGVESFVRQLAWYDVGVRQDGYVIGFTIFTAGGHDYWENYNINPILSDLTAYVKSQQ